MNMGVHLGGSEQELDNSIANAQSCAKPSIRYDC